MIFLHGLKSTSGGGSGFILTAVCVIVLILNAIPFLQGAGSTHVRVHDNLDGVVVNYFLAAKDGYFCAPWAGVSSFPSAVSRFSVVYGFDFWLMLFLWLSPYSAYVLSKLIMMVTAFAGMYWLLNELFQDNNQRLRRGWMLLFATLFSSLPFWGMTNSVCGLPLLWAAVNSLISSKRLPLAFFSLFFVGLSSSLPWVGVFVVPLWLCLWIWLAVRSNSDVRWPVLIGLMVYGGALLLSNFNLIYQVIFPAGFVSHRISWVLPCESWPMTFSRWRYMLRFNQYHAQSLHQFLWPVILLSAFIWLRAKSWIRLLGIFFLIFAASVGALYRNCSLSELRLFVEQFVPLQWDRLYWLVPAVAYVVGFAAFVELYQKIKFRRYFLVGFLLLLCVRAVETFDQHEVVAAERMRVPSFEAYYEIEGVRELRNLVGSSCVDVCGIAPAVAQMNGICTQGFYLSSYPLEFKEAYLADLNLLVDDWGDRLNRMYSWGSRLEVPEFEEGFEFQWQDWRIQGQLSHEYLLYQGEVDLGSGVDLIWTGLYCGERIELYRIC